MLWDITRAVAAASVVLEYLEDAEQFLEEVATPLPGAVGDKADAYGGKEKVTGAVKLVEKPDPFAVEASVAVFTVLWEAKRESVAVLAIDKGAGGTGGD